MIFLRIFFVLLGIIQVAVAGSMTYNLFKRWENIDNCYIKLIDIILILMAVFSVILILLCVFEE